MQAKSGSGVLRYVLNVNVARGKPFRRVGLKSMDGESTDLILKK